MNHDFSNRVVLITGGTLGIGRATARAFATSGATVVIAARRAEEGERAAEELKNLGARASFVATDVRDEASITNSVARTTELFGALHVAINNAGIGGDMQPLEASSTEAYDDVMSTNARSVFLGMRAQVPAIIESGGGAIVNMSSVYGAVGKAAHHAYVASKHAIVGLTKSTAIELAESSVRVNAVCPGATETDAMRAAREFAPELVSTLVDRHPMKRMATEDEVAGAVLWLCSEHASFVTGHALAVDGGLLAA